MAAPFRLRRVRGSGFVSKRGCRRGPSRAAQAAILPVLAQAVLSNAPPAAEDIRDIKGLVRLPGLPWWMWLLIAAGLVGVAAVGYWLWRRRRSGRAAVVPAVVISPYDRAVRDLQALRADQLMEGGAIDLFYTRLSDIVRRYLEEQFQLRAPERTTEEFLQAVTRDDILSAAHQRLLAAFLQESDLVKFARYRPALEDMERAYQTAETFVRETQPPSQRIAESAAVAGTTAPTPAPRSTRSTGSGTSSSSGSPTPRRGWE